MQSFLFKLLARNDLWGKIARGVMLALVIVAAVAGIVLAFYVVGAIMAALLVVAAALVLIGGVWASIFAWRISRQFAKLREQFDACGQPPQQRPAKKVKVNIR